jgi:hypothetical protein
MWSGEDVIADLLDDGHDTITIMNPIVAVPTAQGQMGFAPWSPLLKEKNMDITLKKSYVVMITETQTEVEEYYKEQFSLIKTPSSKLIV